MLFCSILKSLCPIYCFDGLILTSLPCWCGYLVPLPVGVLEVKLEVSLCKKGWYTHYLKKYCNNPWYNDGMWISMFLHIICVVFSTKWCVKNAFWCMWETLKTTSKKWNNTSKMWHKKYSTIKFWYFYRSLRSPFRPKTNPTTVPWNNEIRNLI